MMNERTVGVLLAAVLAVSPLPLAGQERDRFTARVEVPDQSRGARDEVLDDAFERVIQRTTGDPAVASRSGVAELLARAGEFLQRFSYARGEGDNGQDDDAGLELVARFDGDSVRQALIELGIPVWQRDRPPVLAWVAIEDTDGQRVLVGSDRGEAWREALEEAAADLGIELTFPLLDLEDQSQVRFSDVAGGFAGPIREASQRYDTPLILMGSLRAGGGQWRGQWRLFGPEDQRRDWRDVDTDKAPALAHWRDQLAAALRDMYTVLPDSESGESLPVRITGVDGAPDLGWLQDTLSELSGVERVTLQRVEPTRVRFALSLNVDRARVLRTLDRNSALTREDRQQGDGSGNTPVAGPIYQLQR